jgi:hypothetical protein
MATPAQKATAAKQDAAMAARNPAPVVNTPAAKPVVTSKTTTPPKVTTQPADIQAKIDELAALTAKIEKKVGASDAPADNSGVYIATDGTRFTDMASYSAYQKMLNDKTSNAKDASSRLTASLGFVLTRALLDDPTYGKGPGGLQQVYDLWFAGDETAALDAYFKSNYYTKLGRTAAQRYVTKINQPEVYAADEAAYISNQKARLFQLGVRVDDATLTDLMKQAYAGNLTDNQLDSSISTSSKFGGTFGGKILDDIQRFKTIANSYGLSYTDAKYNQWGSDLFSNKITDSEIEQAIMTESASKYPAFSDQIMKGVSLDALSSAYKSSMANLLEVDADSIGYNDATLMKALQYVGPDGKPSTKPLWQFESELRSDARWQYTNNARDTVDSMQYKVMKDWGLI